MNPEDLAKMDKEILIHALETTNTAYDEIMATLVMIREELMHRLNEEKKDGEVIGDYQISKRKRISFKTKLEEAEEFGAVKQAPDTKKLRALYNKGIKIPGVNVTEYLSVRRLSNDG